MKSNYMEAVWLGIKNKTLRDIEEYVRKGECLKHIYDIDIRDVINDRRLN